MSSNSEQNQRKPGFYWVDGRMIGNPNTAQWDGRHWRLPGSETEYSDSDFTEIDETPITTNAAGGKPDNWKDSVRGKVEKYVTSTAAWVGNWEQTVRLICDFYIKQRELDAATASHPAQPEQEGGKGYGELMREADQFASKKADPDKEPHIFQARYVGYLTAAQKYQPQSGKPEPEAVCPECFWRQGVHHFSCSRDKKEPSGQIKASITADKNIPEDVANALKEMIKLAHDNIPSGQPEGQG